MKMKPRKKLLNIGLHLQTSIKPHTDVKDEYSGDKIPSKHNTLKEVDNI
jgi:hypothetical protein